MDVIPYLPKEPQENIVTFALKEKMFSDYLIFKCADSRNGLAECHCTACGHSFDALWGKNADCAINSIAHFTIEGVSYKSWDHIRCPVCGKDVSVRHTGNIHSESIEDMALIQTFSKAERLFIISIWAVIQYTDKMGGQRYEVKPYEHFVFENRKAYTVRCYSNFFSARYPDKPHQLTRFAPPKEIPYTYPHEKDFTAGTYMENSRLDKYLEKTNTRGNAVQYLRCYQGFKRLDALMDLPFSQIIIDEIDCQRHYSFYTSPRAQLSELNKKEKSPYKMLGIDRSEAKVIPWQTISYTDFIHIKTYKTLVGRLTKENVDELLKVSRYERTEIMKYEEAVQIIKYLSKDSRWTWHILKDYWRMAGLLGYDLNNPLVCFPKNLIAKHDDVMQRVKYQKGEMENRKFAVLAEFLKESSCSNGSICIRAAASVEELKNEGKVLRHCVGGYGKQHCEGKSIFFVRKAEQLKEYIIYSKKVIATEEDICL